MIFFFGCSDVGEISFIIFWQSMSSMDWFVLVLFFKPSFFKFHCCSFGKYHGLLFWLIGGLFSLGLGDLGMYAHCQLYVFAWSYTPSLAMYWSVCSWSLLAKSIYLDWSILHVERWLGHILFCFFNDNSKLVLFCIDPICLYWFLMALSQSFKYIIGSSHLKMFSYPCLDLVNNLEVVFDVVGGLSCYFLRSTVWIAGSFICVSNSFWLCSRISHRSSSRLWCPFKISSLSFTTYRLILSSNTLQLSSQRWPNETKDELFKYVTTVVFGASDDFFCLLVGISLLIWPYDTIFW